MKKASPPKFMTESQIVELARGQIGYGRTQRDLAAEAGVSHGYVSTFLAGRKGIGPALLKALGFDPQPYYKKIKD